jgi:glutathione synthase/RimK-type ligase-like ATP-grasp enzyme
LLRIALATCLQWPELTESDRLYAAALAERGLDVTTAPWNGPFAPFASAGSVMLRSTWDYHHAPRAFVAWLSRLGRRGVRVYNPPEIVVWNLRKRYLLELRRRGVQTPRTYVVARDGAAVTRAFDRLRSDAAIVKPAVGASGHEVRLVRRDEIPGLVAALPAGISRLLVQEFMLEVRNGELSCVFFDGDFSHAVLKQPAPGEYRVNSQYQGIVAAVQPQAEVVQQARAALETLPEVPLYARVDGVLRDGAFVLMELELCEPSLYLQYAPGTADRFAEATLRRLRAG